MKLILLSKLMLAVLLGAGMVQAQSLKGSPGSIDRQYRAALSYGYAFVDSGRSLNRYVAPGHLVRVHEGKHIELHDVSYPYGVPATRVFLNRLSSQYHAACGERLTVTSLLRPKDEQPRNSVKKSVHPTGMAIDLRIPRTAKCRRWLERTLLSLERDKVLDVTRERRPPHYHVALFVENYEKRLGIQHSGPTQLAAATPSRGSSSASGGNYTVRRGDTLSEIASSVGVSISRLRAANGLRGNRIYAGQKLNIPTTGTVIAAVNAVPAREYSVRRGDTLSEIAAATGVSAARLRAANGLRGNRIYVGQTLQIPGDIGALASGAITHKVSRGDTLWRIANLYGTSVAQLRRTNAGAGDNLRVGQLIRITNG